MFGVDKIVYPSYEPMYGTYTGSTCGVPPGLPNNYKYKNLTIEKINNFNIFIENYLGDLYPELPSDIKSLRTSYVHVISMQSHIAINACLAIDIYEKYMKNNSENYQEFIKELNEILIF
jgi:hypothetical protein